MSFWIEDTNGVWLGDLTNFTVGAIADDPDAPESLKQFMETGTADGELGLQIVKDLEGNEVYTYLADMLDGAEFPLMITDGVGDVGDDEYEEKSVKDILLKQDEERAERARESHKPSSDAKQSVAREEQAKFAEDIVGVNSPGNQPFDIVKGKAAIEFKTIQDNDNDKITVHPDSHKRKLDYAKQHKMKCHTVGLDVRGGRQYYYKEGIGAFRLSAMEKTTLSALKSKFS